MEKSNENVLASSVETENVSGVTNVNTDYDREPIEDLRVSADDSSITPEERKKSVKKLAGAISHSLRMSGEVAVRAFGSSAISKAAKAIAIAKDYLRATHDELQLSFSPAFIEADIGGQSMTGICFYCFTTAVAEDDKASVESVYVKADGKDVKPEARKASVRGLAGAIAHKLEKNGECSVRAFGSAAIGKASKALAIARGFIATKGPDLYCWTSFIVADIDGSERTGISFYCYVNK